MTNFLNDNMNKPLKMDGVNLLMSLPDDSVDCAFFDPQYRAQLDKLSYGNEGQSRMKKRSALEQMSNSVIMQFLLGIEYSLKPSAYLFLWVDKFTVAEGIHNYWMSEISKSFSGEEALTLVDMIVWDKQSFGMGARSRRTNEYLLVYQETPKTTKN